MPTLQETHFGLVTNNDDPEKRGRLKVQSQSIVSATQELPFWIEPATQLLCPGAGGGSLFLPPIGATVELIVDCHDTEYDQQPNERFFSNPGSMKWRPGTAQTLPAALAAGYPHVRGFVTPAGHILTFDDNGDIIIKHGKSGAQISMTADGHITAGAGGTPLTLINITDYNALKAYIAGLTLTVVGGGGGTAGPPASPPPDAVGTTVFKAE